MGSDEVELTEEPIRATRAKRAFIAGVATYRPGAAVPGLPAFAAGSARAAASRRSTETLVRLLNDVRELRVHIQDHLHIVGVAAVSTRTADASGAASSTLAAASGRLLIVAVAAVLALTAATPDPATSPRLPVSSGEYERQGGICAGRDYEFVSLRRVAAILAWQAGRTAVSYRALMPRLTRVVVIPPERPAIVTVTSLWRIPFAERARNVVRIRWRVRWCVVALKNPF
jgi:hypothetical protein